MFQDREAAAEHYAGVYQDPNYRMGKARKHAAEHAIDQLDTLDGAATLLDVGCGRGEMVEHCWQRGIQATGAEVAREMINQTTIHYSMAHDLLFFSQSFDYLTCFDVLEHILPGDTVPALHEFERVTRSTMLIAVANFSDVRNGIELHINRRTYEDWHELFIQTLPDWDVEWLRDVKSISETFRLTKRA